MTSKKIIALRMDDVGASTKKYEVYSKKLFGNFLFLKRLKYFKAWGPYRELNEFEWNDILKLLYNFNCKLTVGVTAGWVERNGEIVPFNKKFPNLLGVIKEGVESGLLEIANHGLNHFIVGKHLPKYFKSNRFYHREFYDFLPEKVHFEHIKISQQILHNTFGKSITTLIPPGNVYSAKTVRSMRNNRIKVLNSSIKIPEIDDQEYINEEQVIAFHDRELVIYGIEWLKNLVKNIAEENEFRFIKELKK